MLVSLSDLPPSFAMNQTISYTYDKDNRLTKKLYPDGTSVTFTYNGAGKVTSMVDATGTNTYTYDKLYRKTKIVAPGVNNTISYTYDTEGNRLSMTNQDNGVTSYAYDVLNRVTSLANPQGQITKYAYDPVGNILTQTDSNGTVTTHTYSKDNQVLTAKTSNSASHVLASASYTYDTAGLKTSITQDNGNVINYTYDAVHHLAGEVKNTASNTLVYSYAYTYDPLGNRLTMNTNLNGVTLTYNYTYNNLNELTQSVPVAANGTQGAVTAYSYNNDGDLVKKVSAGQTTTYTYDFDNRLTKITYPNATTSAFVYSADDRRLKTTEGTTVTNYLYDGQLPVIERNASNVTQNTYTNGLGYPGGIGGLISQAQGTTTSWYHYVHNGDGNVSSLSNAQGNLAEMYDYEGFGNIAAQSGTITTNTRRYQTKELNISSGLIYFGERWYDPTVGRWTTPDPLGMIDGPNMYLFVHDDPVNFSDAWGLTTWKDVSNASNVESVGCLAGAGACYYFLKNPNCSALFLQGAGALSTVSSTGAFMDAYNNNDPNAAAQAIKSAYFGSFTEGIFKNFTNELNSSALGALASSAYDYASNMTSSDWQELGNSLNYRNPTTDSNSKSFQDPDTGGWGGQ